MCDVTHSYIWRDSFICVTCLIHTCDMSRSYVWHASQHTCRSLGIFDVTHSYVWHDTFVSVAWLIHLYVWHDSFIREAWLIRPCDMTDSNTCRNKRAKQKTEPISHVWMSHVTHTQQHLVFEFVTFSCFKNVRRLMFLRHQNTGLRRPIGCLISCRSFFAKEPQSIGLFCGKWPIKIRHPMTLRHPVSRLKNLQSVWVIFWSSWLIWISRIQLESSKYHKFKSSHELRESSKHSITSLLHSNTSRSWRNRQKTNWRNSRNRSKKRLNKACHAWVSHVSCDRVISNTEKEIKGVCAWICVWIFVWMCMCV